MEEPTLADDHPDMIRIVRAAYHDVPPKAATGQGKSLASALSAALGEAPGTGQDLENIEFLVQVLSVNRAAGEIDDESFERLLERMQTKAGRSELANLFFQELEAENGYEDEMP